MDTAKLFWNGQSQAVRLPKSYRMKGKRVCIKRIGQAIVLFPLESEWEIFDGALKRFSKDFMAERGQPRRQQNRKKAF